MAQFCIEFLLQPAQDVRPQAGHVLVTEGFVDGLVRQAVRQALFARADLFTAVHVEQAHLPDNFTAGPADEFGDAFCRQALVHHQGQVFENRREFRHGRNFVQGRDKRQEHIHIQLRGQERCPAKRGRPVVPLPNLRMQLAKNAQLLMRAGYIHKEMAGVYSYLPLGMRVIENIKQVVREEMDAIGGEELLLSTLQHPMLWKSTDRWDDAKVDVWFKAALGDDSEVGFGWSHEEPMTRLMTQFVNSYKDLPVYAYQFQTKLRRELRAKSGLLRGREFIMKDLYSFTANREEHDKFYALVEEAYMKVYKRLGIGVARGKAIQRLLIQGKPTEVQVNDGAVPETQASVHITKLDDPAQAQPGSSQSNPPKR